MGAIVILSMRLRIAVLAALLLGGCAKRPEIAQKQDVAVVFLDVGQGDAALLRTPENETVLIDTGHNAETARHLREKRIRKIDLMILTHPHEDHIGGVAAVAKAFPIGEIWYSGVDYNARLTKRLEKAGPLEAVSSGKQKQFRNLVLTVLHPDRPNGRRQRRGDSVNNESLVVRADYGQSRYLFPGDCELECWDELFRNHRKDLRADVLKAAHHGSNNGTNSGVLINVRPQTFVISVGRNNEYHHPHPLVLTLVNKLGAQLLRTDEQGEIRCVGAACRTASAW